MARNIRSVTRLNGRHSFGIWHRAHEERECAKKSAPTTVGDGSSGGDEDGVSSMERMAHNYTEFENSDMSVRSYRHPFISNGLLANGRRGVIDRDRGDTGKTKGMFQKEGFPSGGMGGGSYKKGESVI